MKGIYKITNPKGCVYIGKSKDIKKRLDTYRWSFPYPQRKLCQSFHDYGFESHTTEVIEECAEEKLYEREMYSINFYDAYDLEKGLNLAPKNDFVHTYQRPKLVSKVFSISIPMDEVEFMKDNLYESSNIASFIRQSVLFRLRDFRNSDGSVHLSDFR